MAGQTAAPKGVPFGSSTIDQNATLNQDEIRQLAKETVLHSNFFDF